MNPNDLPAYMAHVGAAARAAAGAMAAASTAAKDQALRALDCTAMQGYYLGAPSAEPQFTLDHLHQAIALP